MTPSESSYQQARVEAGALAIIGHISGKSTIKEREKFAKEISELCINAADAVPHPNQDGLLPSELHKIFEYLNKTDNRIENLREATNAQNSRNRKSKNRLAKGVSVHKGRFIARITVDGKTINLGSYDTEQKAADAYEAACVAYHGDFACPKN